MLNLQRYFIFIVLFVLFVAGINADYTPRFLLNLTSNKSPEIEDAENRKLIAQEINPFLQKNYFPSQHIINWNNKLEKVRMLYTLDTSLQSELEKLIKSYAPDYSSTVVLDASTGQILAMSSHEGSKPSDQNRAVKATFPAASIFKIVTAAAAIDKYNLSPEMELGLTGANYTLYKKNLFNESTRNARWMSFREAFAKSINIFFGKMALKFMQPKDLVEYAEKFYFNREVKTDFQLEQSKVQLSTADEYYIAEIASGFNTETMLSPVHGAMIAAAVANDGLMPTPYIVEGVFKEDGASIYKNKPISPFKVISNESAHKLRSMMNDTVESGTSRKSFKELTKKKTFAVLEMGGKTGSITGQNPKGKTEWFVGYGKLGTRMIAVATVVVNKEYWTIKPSFIAQKLIKTYFEKQATIVTSAFEEEKKKVDKN